MNLEPFSELAEMARKLRAREAYREAQQKAARRENGRYLPRASGNRRLAELAHVREPIPNSRAEIWITFTGGREEWLRLRNDPALSEFSRGLLEPDALNGYVAFPKRHAPRIPANCRNLAQYIPVHGGATYAAKDSYAAVWGFDTMHYNSESVPRTDREWIRNECLILYYGLMAAEKLWPRYRRAPANIRAELAQQMLDLLPGAGVENLGFSGLVSLLTGKI